MNDDEEEYDGNDTRDSGDGLVKFIPRNDYVDRTYTTPSTIGSTLVPGVEFCEQLDPALQEDDEPLLEEVDEPPEPPPEPLSLLSPPDVLPVPYVLPGLL